MKCGDFLRSSLPSRESALALLSFAHSMSHSIFLALPPLIPLIAAEGIGIDEIGLAASLAMFLYGAGSLTSGLASSLLGDVRALALSLVLEGLASILVLFAEARTLLILFPLAGLAGSLYHPLANALIMRRFPTQVGKALGVHGAGGNLAQVAYPVASFALASVLGWRAALAVFGLVMVALAASMSRWPAKRVRVAVLTRSALREAAGGSIPLAVLVATAYGLSYRGVEMFLPAFLQIERGADPALASAALSLMLLVGAVGQYVGGKLSDAAGSAVALLLATVAGFASILLLAAPTGLAFALAAASAAGFSFYAHQPAINSFVGKQVPDEHRDALFGFWFFVVFSMASPSSYVAGYLAKNLGFSAAFFAMAALAAISAGLSAALLVVTRSREANPHSSA